MKSFRFPLDRVLEWRRTQLELEEQRLRRLNAELQDINASLVNLEACRRQEQLAVAESGADGSELTALAVYLNWWDGARRDLVERHAQKSRHVAVQAERILGARRPVRLIEHLRERRLAEWNQALRRETESLAAESYLARWTARLRPLTPAPPATRDAGNAG